ncbi:MAG: hypothetical protein ACK5PO_01450 [Bacteroidota bacterium]|jgi:hypothetical protein
MAFPSLYLLYLLEDLSVPHFPNKVADRPSQLSGSFSNYSCDSYVVYEVKFNSFVLFRFSSPVIDLSLPSNVEHSIDNTPHLATVGGQAYTDSDRVISSSDRYLHIESGSSNSRLPPSITGSGSSFPDQAGSSGSFSIGLNSSDSGSSTLVASTSASSSTISPFVTSPVFGTVVMADAEACSIATDILMAQDDSIPSLKSKLYTSDGHLRTDLPDHLTYKFSFPALESDFSDWYSKNKGQFQFHLPVSSPDHNQSSSTRRNISPPVLSNQSSSTRRNISPPAAPRAPSKGSITSLETHFPFE